MWLRNCWYVIAWDHEIPAAGSRDLFSRTVLGEPILVLRREDGALAALEDRCCHRSAPLSKGRRESDCVRCGYHGLMFDAAGRCVDALGLPAVPPKAPVRTYPVVLQRRWVFVWMGDPARADRKLLPHNCSCDDPAWQHRPGYMHYETPYLLICDNLLDLSHLGYVHERTLGGSTAIAQAVPTIERIDAPRHSGGRPVGDAPDHLSNAVRLHSCQTLTRETATSTHCFFQQSHPAGQGDASLTEGIYESLVAAFNEDRDIITAQHRKLLRPDALMLPLAMDSALIQFRRLLAERVRPEGAVAAAPAMRTGTPDPALS